MQPHYEYRHTIGLEETNIVGNVYFVNHLRWQGRCREMFLRDHAPGVLAQLAEGLSLVTVRCACEYHVELAPLDEISVWLFLDEIALNRISLRFEYWRIRPGPRQLIAEGSQVVACMWKSPAGLVAAEVPQELRTSLIPFEVAHAVR